MLRKIKAYLFFIKVFAPILYWTIRQQVFYLFILRKKINKLFEVTDYSIQKNDKKRVRFFATYVPVMMGEGFSLIRKKKLTFQERKLLMLLSAATPLFDDFFDDENLSINNLELLIAQGIHYIPQNTKEKILLEISLLIKPLLKNESDYIQLCLLIFEKQKLANKLQKNNTTSWEEIKKITFEKSGNSTLLYWHILKNNDALEIKEIVYLSGALTQYTDDIFDIWFDDKDGIITLANKAETINFLEHDFKNEIKKIVTKVDLLPLEKKKKVKFLQLQFFFFSRGLVALHQLKNCCQNESLFISKSHTRSQLVCDMEKVKNNITWINIFYESYNEVVSF